MVSSEELNDRLVAKMEHEQERLSERMQGADGIRLLPLAYEYMVREELIFALRCGPTIDGPYAAAMLQSDTPLEDLYLFWKQRMQERLQFYGQAIVEQARRAKLFYDMRKENEGDQET